MARKWQELTEENQQQVLNTQLPTDIAPMERVKRIAAFISLVFEGDYYFDKQGNMFVGVPVEKCPSSRANLSYCDDKTYRADTRINKANLTQE